MIRRARGVAQHHGHLIQADIKLLGDDLRQGGAHPGAEIDMAVEAENPPRAVDQHERHGRLARLVDDQAVVQRQQRQVIERRRIDRRQGDASAALAAAARATARAISTCVPQRQRLNFSASAICAAVAEGVFSSSACAVTIMPLRQ